MLRRCLRNVVFNELLIRCGISAPNKHNWKTAILNGNVVWMVLLEVGNQPREVRIHHFVWVYWPSHATLLLERNSSGRSLYASIFNYQYTTVWGGKHTSSPRVKHCTQVKIRLR